MVCIPDLFIRKIKAREAPNPSTPEIKSQQEQGETSGVPLGKVRMQACPSDGFPLLSWA